MKLSRLNDQATKMENSREAQFATDILTGLSAFPKRISAKYFYDDKGSELFQKITQHSDYYPTRTEFSILQSMRTELPKIINEKEVDLIELGAGDGHKSQLVLEELLESGIKVNFYPVDISEKAMVLLENNIVQHPDLKLHGIVAEYFEGLRFVRGLSLNKQLVLFLGSNIGNFDIQQTKVFLQTLWNSLNNNDLSLIGFDLKKDINILNKAYNDSAGHTQEFNLNLLNRINIELGGQFILSKFRHLATYNPILGAMESYLLSTESQDVVISHLSRSFHFDKLEPIHLEYSFKFLESDIDELARESGFKVIKHFADQNRYFIDSLWQVSKDSSL